MQDDHDDHDLGLAHDLQTLRRSIDRRRLLGWLAAVGAGGAVGCGGGGDATSSATASTTATTASTATSTTGTTTSGGTTATTPSAGTSSCSTIPEETAGPYPADGSNAAAGSTSNALALSGIVRSDIRSSIAGASGVATGVPLTVTLRLVNSGASCADLAGYAIYLWHCDQLGRYSLYSAGITGENYLRGVQQTDSSGSVTFTTIFPACYSGRMPHIHFEVYRTPTTASSWTNKLKTSQLALPVDVCNAVYATSGYAASVANLARISFATDNVFSDGVSTQLATVTGSVSAGYTATLVVGISV